MCILVHAVKRQSLDLPLEGRIIGSFIPMPACRVFSMFAALAVLLDFLLQVTAFVALIVFDFMRAEDNRIDCFPCIKFHHLLWNLMKWWEVPNRRNWGVRSPVSQLLPPLLADLDFHWREESTT
ncbi:Niemann-Pick type protein-like 1B [Vitis vinifera]|uniref:Niemann-Pick type protein-like 1B n=1 Tax=Vitis vinifera TaxID=29760 RepID=A0A438JTW1_VITVI|nr:Niemann-Pick type protein-like 1B [Vitis vinifera]